MAEELINHQDRLHSKYSPSSLKHREICPGWESENKENDAAAVGTRVHEAMQAYYEGNEAPWKALAEIEQWWLTECIEFNEALLAGHEQVIPERRLFADHHLLKELNHGTPDLIVLYGGDKGHIIDLKTGIRRVDHPKDNLQAFSYVIAFFDTFPERTEVTFTFEAPRLLDGFQSHTFTRAEDYDRLLVRVLRTIERCEAPEKTLNPVWASCVYCAKKADCKALAGALQTIYEKEASPETRPITGEEISSALAEDSPENLAFLHLVAGVAEAWAEARKNYTLDKAQQGEEVNGFEIRFKNGRTSVTSTADVANALKNYDLPVDRLAESSTVSLQALENLFCNGFEGREKTARKKLLLKELSTAGALKTTEPSPYLYRV